jgi:hypothetical protein
MASLEGGVPRRVREDDYVQRRIPYAECDDRLGRREVRIQFTAILPFGCPYIVSSRDRGGMGRETDSKE